MEYITYFANKRIEKTIHVFSPVSQRSCKKHYTPYTRVFEARLIQSEGTIVVSQASVNRSTSICIGKVMTSLG